MMILVWVVLPALVLFPVYISLFHSAKRAVELLAPQKSVKFRRVVSILVSAALWLPALNLFGALGVWSVLVMHFCVFGLLTNLLRRIVLRVRKTPPARVWNVLWHLSVLPLVLTVAVFCYGYVNMRQLYETDYTIYTDKAVPEAGYRGALLADTHYGNVTGHDRVASLVQTLNEKQLDFVLLGGDIVDEGTTRAEMEDVFALLGNLRTTYGVYFVYGNHDRAHYSSPPQFSDEELSAAMAENHITVLEDEAVTLTDSLTLIGRKDRSEERISAQKLMAGVNPDAFSMMLDHQPNEFPEKADAGVDLQLSGHTHAGQIFPIGFMITLLHTSDLYYGHTTVGGMDAIVTAGVSGWGYPIRTQAHSEYVLFTIAPKSA